MAPPLKIISIVWRIIEPSMIFLSKSEQSMLYFTPIACTTIITGDLYVSVEKGLGSI